MHRNRMPLSLAALALGGVLIAAPALAQYPQGRGANDGGMVSAKTGAEQQSTTPKTAPTKTSQTAPKAQAAPRETAQKYPVGRHINDGGFVTTQTQNQPPVERQFAWEGNNAAYGGQYGGGPYRAAALSGGRQYYDYQPGYGFQGNPGYGGGYRPGYAWQGNPGYADQYSGGPYRGAALYGGRQYYDYQPGYAWRGNAGFGAYRPGYAPQGNAGYVGQQSAWAGNDLVGGDYYDFAPGWDSGPTTVSMTASMGGSDIAACQARFRSFDPASGTYLGFDGQRHPCP